MESFNWATRFSQQYKSTGSNKGKYKSSNHDIYIVVRKSFLTAGSFLSIHAAISGSSMSTGL